MGCATATIKYTVFLFNILCAILGIGTIVVSSLALSSYKDEGRLVCIFFIVYGCITFLVSFFGCYGAIRENVCFTWTYAFFLLMLFIGSVVLHFGFLNGEAEAHKAIDKAWALQLNGTDGMAHIQSTLYCCGKHNSTDYTNANLTIPSSCEKTDYKGNVTDIYPSGCLSKLIAVYEAAERWVKIFSWGTLSVEAIAFISACILAITFRNQKRRFRY